VNPRQVTLNVKLSLTLIPKSIKTHNYASLYKSLREQYFIIFNPFSIKPLHGFILLKQEVYKGINQDIISLNIIKKKYNYKAVFMFKYLFLNLIIKLSLKFYISFLAKITYKKLKLRIYNLLTLLKKSCKLKTYLYKA
jgi:hypothetical protein